MKRAMMKPVRAWAVLEKNGRLAVCDSRLPICWRRPVAMQFGDEHVIRAKIVRVEIREIAPRKRKAA